MTVQELIDKLQQFNGDLLVEYPSGFGTNFIVDDVELGDDDTVIIL